jgi:hypothetical protein
MTRFLAAPLLLLASTSCMFSQQTPATGQRADFPEAPEAHLVLAARVDDAWQASSSSQPEPSPQEADPAADARVQTPQQPDATQQDSRSQAERELKQQESQRMLGVVPAFNSVIGGHAAPLTSRQKFSLYLRSTTDPFVFAVTALDAGYEEVGDQFTGYGWGPAGYFKRYGASLADSVDGNFWGNAVLPSLLHQDPRYFRLGHGTITHRILYAAATTVICKGDNGKWQPSYSNIGGNFIGGAISNLYYPPADRGISLTLENGATVTAEGALGALALEFYPDASRWWHNRHNRKNAAAAQTSAP